MSDRISRVIAIDPGTEQSALIELSLPSLSVVALHLDPNERIRDRLKCATRREDTHLAVEMIASYGMAVGREVFETCVWIGRFVESWKGEHSLVYRREVKLELCGSPRAKDANVRAALIDLYGPGKGKAVGTKKEPGPLYGVKSHLWAALGVGVAWYWKRSVPRSLDCGGG